MQSGACLLRRIITHRHDHPAIGDDHERIEIKELRDARLVVLHLIEGPQRVRLLLIRVLQLEEHHREAVQVDQHIRPPVVLAANGELVHHAEVVVRHVMPVHQMDVLDVLADVRLAIALLKAASQQRMEVHVPLHRRHPFGVAGFDDRRFDGLCVQMRIAKGKKRPHPVRDHHFVQSPRNAAAILVAVAQRLQTLDRRRFKRTRFLGWASTAI